MTDGRGQQDAPRGEVQAPPPRETSAANRSRAWRMLKGPLVLASYGAALVALLLGGLKLIDRTVAGGKPSAPGIERDPGGLTIRTLDLYPYESFHVQANYHHRGPMPWEDRPGVDFDVRTGDRGFFVDFPLDRPPPKAPEEFRIILTGGSGAQGWGGTRNETMFYSVLERALNERLGARGVRVRVVNLAMGATFAYQNYIALNRYAHGLEPDLILAYVGRNDFFIPVHHERGTDVPLLFNELSAFSLATRGSESPPGLAWLADFLPNVMHRTSVGVGLKIAFGWPHFQRRAREDYQRALGPRALSMQQVIDDTAVPLLVHSLKSIKRDFGGVPILVAWQALGREFQLLREHLAPDFYDRMYERTRGELDGYLNRDWTFVNIHAFGRDFPRAGFGTHLEDAAHALTGQRLADEIERLVPGLLADRERRRAAGLPAYGR